MSKKHLCLLLCIQRCRSPLMQQTEEQSHRPPVLENKRDSLMWLCVIEKATGTHISVLTLASRGLALFLGLITPFHSPPNFSTDSHHHHYTTHCAFLIEVQSTTIKSITTSSRPAFCFSNTLQSQFPKWQALEGPAPCQLMAPSPSFSMSS